MPPELTPGEALAAGLLHGVLLDLLDELNEAATDALVAALNACQHRGVPNER